MKLKYVTITGADDKIDTKDLIEISEDFPFVEWGVLISSTKSGQSRYPSIEWIENFSHKKSEGMNISVHLCGKMVRKMLIGERETKYWAFYPEIFLKERGMNSRIQINSNISKCKYDAEVFTKNLATTHKYYPDVSFITQYHEGNKDILWNDLAHYGIRQHILFDSSGGRGIYTFSDPPPEPIRGFFCGYAGGINPDNVQTLIDVLDNMGKGICWIDMESGIRDSDNNFDLNKVVDILEKCAEYIV